MLFTRSQFRQFTANLESLRADVNTLDGLIRRTEHKVDLTHTPFEREYYTLVGEFKSKIAEIAAAMPSAAAQSNSHSNSQSQQAQAQAQAQALLQ